MFVNFASQQKDESDEFDEKALGLRHQSRGIGRLPSMLLDGNIRFSSLQDDDDDDYRVTFDGTVSIMDCVT